MPAPQATALLFPRGGVVRNLSFCEQAPRTTPAASNIWPARPLNGRLGGGTRPDFVATGGSVGGSPCHGIDFAYKGSGGTHAAFVARVAAVVADGYGTKISADGATWSAAIAHDPDSDFCSVAAFRQILFQASAGHQHIYYKDYSDASSGTLAGNPSPVDSTAVPPQYAGAICNWNGRLLVGGIKNEPHVVRGSALGDPFAWDESSTDPDAAFGTTGAGDSKIGEPVVVTFAHNHDCAMVGGPSSCYVLRGNPLANGFIAKISPNLGPISMAAICKSGDDDSFMVTRVGPYVMRSGCGEPLIPIGGAIPNDLVGIDPADGNWASCVYDARWRMIHFIADNGTGVAFWSYQVDDKSWWLSEPTDEFRLGFQLPPLATGDASSSLFAVSGGSVSTVDRSVQSETIDSYLDFGPFELASPGNMGMLTGLNIELASGSSAVDAEVYVGDSADTVMAATTPQRTYRFSRSGYNPESRPRLRGGAARVRVKSVDGGRFAVEKLIPTIATVAGRRAE